MELSRRCFLKGGVGSGLALALLPGLALLEGCPVSQSQLEQLVQEVGTGLAGIMPYLQSIDAATAAKIEAGFTALEGAISNWTPGGAISSIEQAVNAFVANMNLIPVLGSYQALVALCVATAEGIITLLIPNSGGQVTVQARGRVYYNPPRTRRAFRNAWNKVVAGDPKIANLKLRS